MKTFSRRIFSVPCLLVLSGIFSGLILEAAPRPTTVLSGNVIVKRKNVSTTSSVGARGSLQAGDVVATSANSNASLQFADGSKVSLAGNSAVEITKPGKNNTLMRALNGRVEASLKSGKTIATRSAMIRVKGTEIVITIAADGATTLEVLEGSAEFFNPCGSVLVHRGERSEAKPGNAPSTPSQIPNLDDLLREWKIGIAKSTDKDQKPTVTLAKAKAKPVVVKPSAITETKG